MKYIMNNNSISIITRSKHNMAFNARWIYDQQCGSMKLYDIVNLHCISHYIYNDIIQSASQPTLYQISILFHYLCYLENVLTL